jgi:hypothetical protein
VQAHWKTFLADLEGTADPPVLPGFVTAEVEAFLRCGRLEHGLVLVRCGDCGWCTPVALSCQRRGFCTSCIGRRMCDFAARAVDRIFPRVPIRQWVLTCPRDLRPRLAADPDLTTLVLRSFVAAVSSWLRRQGRRLGLRGALKTGGVTVIQRFNSALDASVHFHTLMLDGVYSFPAAGRAPLFHPTRAPSDEDVADVAAAVWRNVQRKLGAYAPSAAERRHAEDAPVLRAMEEAAAAGVVATGPRRGCRLVRVRGPAATEADALVLGRACAEVEGYNLQAATRLAANDREGLQRMCRYLARPPIANERLARLDDGRLELRLKKPWRDGTTALRFEPHELLERLVAQVPRPRRHLTRYFGVLAPAFAARAQIVPAQDRPEPAPSARPSPPPSPPPPGCEPPRGPGRHPWAALLWRMLRIDALVCQRCSGRMKVVAAVLAPAEVRRILAHLGLPHDTSGFHPARPPPQLALPLDAAPAAFEPDPPAPDDFSA